jgi:hypothetical protein
VAALRRAPEKADALAHAGVEPVAAVDVLRVDVAERRGRAEEGEPERGARAVVRPEEILTAPAVEDLAMDEKIEIGTATGKKTKKEKEQGKEVVTGRRRSAVVEKEDVAFG